MLRKVIKSVLWTAMAILLLPTAILLILYSQWGQDRLRTRLIQGLNDNGGIELRLDSLSLRFPLKLDLRGLAMIQQSDTLIAAGRAQVDVKLLPLLRGHVDISKLILNSARYQMGNADSLSMMVIRADSINLAPASVALASLSISADDGYIYRGAFSLASKVDTAVVKPDSVAATDLSIRVRRVALRDFTFDMSIEGSIDSLGAHVGNGVVSAVDVRLLPQTVNIGSFIGEQIDAAVILADSAQIAEAPVAPPSPPTLPWTVEIDSIAFSQSRALYTTHGYVPEPGLDFGYIEVDSLDVSIHDLYNQAIKLSLPLSVQGRERCGVWLDATGTFAMDSTEMRFTDFIINTPYSGITADGVLGMGDLTTDPNLPLSLDVAAKIGIRDIKSMFPIAAPYLAGVSDATPVTLGIGLDGTTSRLAISRANLKINNCLSLSASGRLTDMFAKNGPNGNLSLSGNIIDIKSITKQIFEPGSGMAIPPMTLDGKVTMRYGDIDGTLDATTLGGKLAFSGNYQAREESYKLQLSTQDFPVNAFMTDLGVGRVTLTMDAEGNGFDLFSPATNAELHISAPAVQYEDYTYRALSLAATLHDGTAHVAADSHSRDLAASLRATGNLDGDSYDWNASIDGSHIDLQAIKMSETPAEVSFQLSATANASSDFHNLEASALLSDLTYTEDTGAYTISNVKAVMHAADSLTNLTVTNRDFQAGVDFNCSLDSLLTTFSDFSALLDRQLLERRLNPDSLQMALPKFTMYASGGSDNFINDILAESRMRFKHLQIDAANDSTLFLDSELLGLRAPTFALDSIRFDINQKHRTIDVRASVDNRPGTFDEIAHAAVDLTLNANKISVHGIQRDVHNVVGYDIGAQITQVDSTASLTFTTLTPIIAYKPWTINPDNYIDYNFPHRYIDANLYMKSDKSSLSIYSASMPIGPMQGLAHNDIMIDIGNVKIADWIQLNPFSPPITGDLSAKMRVIWEGSDEIDADGVVNFDNFYYDKMRVGSFATNVDVKTNTAGMIRANANLLVDGVETVKLTGLLNDSTATAPMDLDVDVMKFPLGVANPFLPADMAQLRGTLNGTMCLNGETDSLRLNGEVYFDNAAVKAAMTNTEYAISDVKIPVDASIVKFNNFGIQGTNDNPLLLNGTVDMRSFINPSWDLNLKANNMMLVNSKSATKNAEIFGKAYINLSGSVVGSLRFTKIDADLTVLSGTNVTYLMNFATSALSPMATNTDMVKFVNFNNPEEVVAADSISSAEMLMSIDANLTLQSGVTITVDLPTGARDKVQLQPQGTLNYTQAPLSDGRMTGRIVLNGGMARYTIPVIGGEKQFTIDQGSYVAFNGDIMNPTINLHAVDAVKANVNIEGQNSRMVNFNVMLGVTGTLNTMDVKFDLDTNDDITIANELQSMSPEQRANQAMNMLLYNTYTGPGTKTSANNPLFSFLTSKVNNWAANNIKGVDLSFGINQFDATNNGSTSTQMSYSYQVSKSLFNDRFKIVVGGNYSTDDNPEENLSQNLINDISFEYFLNAKQTMLLKLFRHTGFESILEGEVTQTGVGFVYRRKMGRLATILPKFMRPSRRSSEPKSEAANPEPTDQSSEPKAEATNPESKEQSKESAQ